ncbi:hypothetical protein HK102_006137 [Quaeritorhiza haematococci]|nr:hypothetical protein HK102_006137 [Quaeritorhiza haematococci]
MRAQYGFDRCEYADQLGALLKEYAAEKVHVIDGSDLSALHKAGSGVTVVDSHLRSAIAEARVFKTKGEIEVIRMAAKITGEAHIALMKSLKTGVTTETEMHARFVYECARKGAQFQAYTPIVAGAKRGAVLHYVKNNEPLPTNPHDFVLVDAGCEYNLYAGDVTRTYPVGGKFVDEWKTTYEIVLDAQKAVLNALKPGVEWEDMHRLATRVICEGLQKAGILRGSTEELLKHHLPALFFPHGLGHLIGIDVHDVGGYPAGVERIQEPGIRYLRMRRTLKPGMYVTVEPGVYFVDTILEPALKDPNTSKYIDLPTLERFRSKVGGVRIEDDVLITESGIENMTGWIPKEIPDIERVMNE